MLFLLCLLTLILNITEEQAEEEERRKGLMLYLQKNKHTTYLYINSLLISLYFFSNVKIKLSIWRLNNQTTYLF